MGYESRIIVVNRYRWDDSEKDANGNNYGYCETLATFNLAKIDGELINLFKKPFDNAMRCYEGESSSDLYLGGGIGERLKTDPYGSVPKECDLKTFYETLVECNKRERYRRYEMLLAFLTPLLYTDAWDEIVIVHTGY